MPEQEIRACMNQIKERQLMKRNGTLPIDAPLCTRASYIHFLKKVVGHGPSANGTAALNLGNDYNPLDDSKHKPTQIDSVLIGTARATGASAKAVKRRKTMTKYEYDNLHKEEE